MTEASLTRAQKTMEEYKREFAKIEEGFRAELARCNKLALQLSSFHDGSETFSLLRTQHDEVNQNIADYISKMETIIKAASLTVSKMTLKEKNMLMRLKQIKHDCTREYKQYEDVIENKIASRSLYGSRKEPLEVSESAKAMLNNQKQISSSIMIAMDIIDSGKIINDEFKSQNHKIKGTNTKLEQIVTVVPGLDKIMNKIWCLKSRNNVIIGCVIAVMFILTYILWKQ